MAIHNDIIRAITKFKSLSQLLIGTLDWDLLSFFLSAHAKMNSVGDIYPTVCIKILLISFFSSCECILQVAGCFFFQYLQ